jgi:hypothetical protein
VLAGPGAIIVGSARLNVPHATSGALAGAGAIIVGSAVKTTNHATSGVLVGDGAVVTGEAARVSLYPDPSDVRAGVQYGPGGIYVGTLDGVASELNIILRPFGGRF